MQAELVPRFRWSKQPDLGAGAVMLTGARPRPSRADGRAGRSVTGGDRRQTAAAAARKRVAKQRTLEGSAEASGVKQEAWRLCGARDEHRPMFWVYVLGVAAAAGWFLVENGR